MRPTLDPDVAHDNCIRNAPLSEFTALNELPPIIRAFGFYPAIDQLQPGDLLLFSPKKPRYLSRRIQSSQRLSFGLEHAKWTHAALYVFDNVIIEATPLRGTAIGFLSEYVPGYEILVRRGHNVNFRLQTEIVFNAIVKIPRSYSLLAPIEAAYRLAGIARNIVGRTANFNICSVVYTDAWLAATMSMLEGCHGRRIPTPAHLSATPTLKDERIQWMQI